MTGDHREGALRTALREFLPPAVHVGTGRVFSADGTLSNQIDVVIHDGRYPVFRQGDSCLFPREAVIATIEVKSLLNGAAIEGAWATCMSVAKLKTSCAAEDVQDLDQRLIAKGLDKSEREESLERYLYPPSYIFGYDGLATQASLNQTIDSLTTTIGIMMSPRGRPMIPSVISTGHVVGLAWSDPVRVAPNGAPLDPSLTPLYVSVDSSHGFGILAAHLLWTIELRSTFSSPQMGLRSTVLEYLPFQEFLKATVENGPFSVLSFRP